MGYDSFMLKYPINFELYGVLIVLPLVAKIGFL